MYIEPQLLTPCHYGSLKIGSQCMGSVSILKTCQCYIKISSCIIFSIIFMIGVCKVTSFQRASDFTIIFMYLIYYIVHWTTTVNTLSLWVSKKNGVTMYALGFYIKKHVDVILWFLTNLAEKHLVSLIAFVFQLSCLYFIFRSCNAVNEISKLETLNQGRFCLRKNNLFYCLFACFFAILLEVLSNKQISHLI